MKTKKLSKKLGLNKAILSLNQTEMTDIKAGFFGTSINSDVADSSYVFIGAKSNHD